MGSSVWRVIEATAEHSTVAERADQFDNVGLVGGLPITNNEVDLLAALFLKFNPKLHQDIEKVNEVAMAASSW